MKTRNRGTDIRINMTGDQYRKAIERLGLSQGAAAAMLGVSPRTGRLWIANGPPQPVAMLLRLMLGEDKTEFWIEQAKKASAA